MVSSFVDLHMTLIFLTLFSSFFFCLVNPTEFLVGGDDGWGVPKKDEEADNHWTSQNRFKVNDTVDFKYKKDSVMVVTEEEYKKCRSARPLFYSNNGDTILELDRPGLFYFISGVTGHCERGQKMIIKVLEPESHPQAGNDTSPANNKNGVVSTRMNCVAPTLVVLLVSLFLMGELLI